MDTTGLFIVEKILKVIALYFGGLVALFGLLDVRHGERQEWLRAWFRAMR